MIIINEIRINKRKNFENKINKTNNNDDNNNNDKKEPAEYGLCRSG